MLHDEAEKVLKGMCAHEEEFGLSSKSCWRIMQQWVWWENQIGADKDYGSLNKNIKWTNLTRLKETKLTQLEIG